MLTSNMLLLLHSVEITEFYVTQILREIKVGKCRVLKSTILAFLKAPHFDFVLIFAPF